ncbi:MAG: DUF3105 domain-containing protein [Actinomycetota bacterium]
MSRRLAAAVAVSATLAAACGGDGAAAICEPEERIIEPSSLHVIGDTDVVYESSPPTSGPHQVPAPEGGIRTEALSEPLQVGTLETGAVILQYQPGIAPGPLADLEALARTEGVLVTPAARPFDDGAAVAFTAWGVVQRCSEVDGDAAEAFIDDHLGVFFVNHDG